MTPRRFNKGEEKQKTQNDQERIMCHKNHPSNKEEVDANDEIWDVALPRLPFSRLWTKLCEFSTEAQIVDRIGN